MKYMGSKARIKKEILPLILKDRKENQYFVDLMCGGFNLIDSVEGNRIANDLNYYLIEMFRALLGGWIPCDFYDKDFYNEVKNNKEKFPPYLVGWLGFVCSFSGKWFGGFAGYYPESRRSKTGILPSYQNESKKSILKQLEKLKDVLIFNEKYFEIEIPENSIVYFDPPYKGTTKYFTDFDHDFFYNYVRKLKKEGHQVFVSEYEMPSDFICIWEKEISSQLSANGKIGGSKNSVEKLFTL